MISPGAAGADLGLLFRGPGFVTEAWKSEAALDAENQEFLGTQKNVQILTLRLQIPLLARWLKSVRLEK